MKQTGIYKIENILNGKKYIGSATDLRARQILHWRQLEKEIHHSRRLQRAWNKYGPDNFQFHIILICDKQNLICYEQLIIDLYLSANKKYGYNICPIAGSALGIKRSEETLAKLRARRASVETRALQSLRAKQRKPSQNQLMALAAQRGLPRSLKAI
jgi:group I intron endonuclease